MKLTALALSTPPALPGHSAAPPAIAELLALRDVEVVDVAPLAGVERAIAPRPSAELLRLPTPPVRAADGAALFRALGDAVDRFDATAQAPIRAARDVVRAEGRMIALLRGLHGLESEIRSEITRRARA